MTENEELLRWVPPTRLYDASPSAAPIGEAMTKISSTMIVYAVVDDALSPDFPARFELEVFVRREDAERFIEEVRGDDPEAEVKLRIEERELEAGGLKSRETGDDGQPSNPVVRIDATVS